MSVLPHSPHPASTLYRGAAVLLDHQYALKGTLTFIYKLYGIFHF